MSKVQRVALQTIILQRDGRNFVPAIGDVVELTETEFNHINEVNPDALGKIQLNKSVAKAVIDSAVDVEAIKKKAVEDYLAAQAKAAEDKPAKSTTKKTAKADADDEL